MKIEGVGPRMSRALQKMAYSAETEEKKIGQPKAPKTNILLSDSDVLLARAKYHYEGANQRQLAKEFGTSVDYMYKLMEYRTRSKLVPKRPEKK